MTKYLRLSLVAFGVLVCTAVIVQRANAALTFSATTITSDANLLLSPTGNLGIGNANPQALLDVGTAGTRAGIIKVNGSTSGTITIQPAAAAGTWTLTLPTTAGTNGQVLTTNGSGVTSWTTVAAGGLSCSGCTTNTIPKTTGVGTLGDSTITDTGIIIFLGGDNAIVPSTDVINFAIGKTAQLFLNNVPDQSCLGDCEGNVHNTNITIDDSAQSIMLGGGFGTIFDLGNAKITGNILPSSLNSYNVGANGLPYRSFYIGNSSTSIQITGVATVAQTATFPDATGIVQLSSTAAFASLPTCNSTNEGMVRGVNNSNTNVWGATIAGGGSNHVLAFCNGTNWTVAGK